MPYRLITAPEPEIDPSYVDAIAQELRLMRPDGSADAPLIIEEQIRRSNRIHVTVIWDRWHNLAPEDRSRIIMDAYERVRGAGAVLTLSAALGFTHSEAQKLGVEQGVYHAA